MTARSRYLAIFATHGPAYSRIVAYSSVTLRPTDWDWRGRADRAADELDGVSVGGGFLGTLAGFAAGGDEFQEIEKN